MHDMLTTALFQETAKGITQKICNEFIQHDNYDQEEMLYLLEDLTSQIWIYKSELNTFSVFKDIDAFARDELAKVVLSTYGLAQKTAIGIALHTYKYVLPDYYMTREAFRAVKKKYKLDEDGNVILR